MSKLLASLVAGNSDIAGVVASIAGAVVAITTYAEKIGAALPTDQEGLLAFLGSAGALVLGLLVSSKGK